MEYVAVLFQVLCTSICVSCMWLLVRTVAESSSDLLGGGRSGDSAARRRASKEIVDRRARSDR